MRDYEAGEGGELAPLMCVDKAAAALAGFDALCAEAAQAGPPWAIVFTAALSGRNGQPPRRPTSTPRCSTWSMPSRPGGWKACCPSTARASRCTWPEEADAMPDDLLQRLRRFHDHTFPGVQDTFETW